MSNGDDGFNSKNWVWVPEKEFFAKGYIIDYLNDGKCKVAVINGNKESHRVVESKQLENCNPAKFNKCEDMAELTHLNEPSVVYNLYLRYNDDMIYTYSGLFLVAINPYKSLNIYDGVTLKKYHSADGERPPPHIFATAEGTYRNLLANKKDQSILVTGESGAGKTENTKKIIQYLSSIAPDDAENAHDRSIETKILGANPILESFGNAKTIKNNNSSRFGKFIKIFFSSKGAISGAVIDYYLLEKSRVVGQSIEERNYHVFYQLLKGSEKHLKEFKLTGSADDYSYLTEGSIDVPRVDDKKEFSILVDAFNTMGFEEPEIEFIFRILAVILHLGNLDFGSWKAEQASFKSGTPINVVADLLGVNEAELTQQFIRPKVKAGREMVQKSRKAPEVKFTIDALSKHLYERIFEYIITRINDNLMIDSSEDILNFIGVLDIAGFEIFKHNSFEQLCINYTNEKLQQFFNHHSFILEQSEYLREDIQWEFIDFGLDLQPTIDLIETKKPMGVFEVLNEECMIPKSSDKSFMEKLAASWGNGKSPKFEQNKIKSGFIIHHYADKVEYNVENWLQKNTDPVSVDILKLLADSKNKYIKDLIKTDDHLVSEMSSNKRERKAKTISQKHKEQLFNLMDQLERTEPHFVRCILPNLHKKPNKFDKTLVLNQLRCNGVLEGIRITRAGYPNRMTFEEFYSRYHVINVKELYTKNTKTNCELILKFTKLDAESYKIGITKLFFKNGILGKLEEMRDMCLKSIFTDLQSLIRGNSARSSIKSKIREIQSSQLIAKTFKKVDESLATSRWLDLFINIKPLLEESVKVLDSKELNETLKSISSKLKDAEKSNTSLETENKQLRSYNTELENDVIKTSEIVKEKASLLEQFKSSEKSEKERTKSLNEQITKLKEFEVAYGKEKKQLQSSLEALNKQIKEKTQSHLKVETEHEQTSKKASMLEETVKELQKQVKTTQKTVQTLESEHKKLTSEKQSFELAMKSMKEEISAKDEIINKSKDLDKETVSLKSLVGSYKSEHSSYQKKITELEIKLSESNSKLDELSCSHKDSSNRLSAREKELEEKTLELSKLRATSDSSIRENGRLQKEIEQLRSAKKELSVKEEKEMKQLSEIRSLKSELKTVSTESSVISKSLNELKVKHEDALKAKSDYLGQISSLNSRLKGIEKSNRDIEVKKENIPPNESFMDDYANLKLKLNEQTAMLRKERFENKKSIEELKLLKNRISSSPSKSDSQSRRSVALGEDADSGFGSDIMKEQIDTLKFELQQEASNAQRAENYAVELQKKLNKLQSTRGINSWNDYETKYKEAQRRIHELEEKFKDILPVDPSSPRPLTKSESFNRSSVINKTLASANQDFIMIYHDITRTLKATREELTSSKSEILRLKSLLRESEDELYEVKKDTFKISMGNFDEELASLKVKNDTLTSKNSEMTKNLDFFKKRSDDYYKKLELAESAIKISKRHEEAATKELESVKNELRLTKEESRATQILIKDLNKQNASLEESLNDKGYEINQLQTKIKDAEEKISYYSNSYENKELVETYKEEVKDLNRELNFKLQTETSLIKENKKYLLDYEDAVRENKSIQSDLDQNIEELQRLDALSVKLQNKCVSLENEKEIHERKISNFTKQVESLKELLSETSKQKDELLLSNNQLEAQVRDLTQSLDDANHHLDKSKFDLEILRQHLESQRTESSEIRSELNQSKMSTSTDIQDYQKIKRENLVVSEENESLKKVNKQLNEKVHDLQEKLYGDEQLKFWESKVDELKNELSKSQNENYESSKRINNLEREAKKLQIRFENENQLTKKYNDENFDYKNKVNHYKSTIDILHSDNSEKDIMLKSKEREAAELKDNMLEMEAEVLRLREQLGLR